MTHPHICMWKLATCDSLISQQKLRSMHNPYRRVILYHKVLRVYPINSVHIAIIICILLYHSIPFYKIYILTISDNKIICTQPWNGNFIIKSLPLPQYSKSVHPAHLKFLVYYHGIYHVIESHYII